MELLSFCGSCMSFFDDIVCGARAGTNIEGGRTDPPPMGSERAGTPATTWTTLCGCGNDHGRPGPKKVSTPFWGRGATVMMRAFFSSPEERMAVWPSTDDDAFIGSTR